jgi:hypothetical protein
VHKKTKPAHAKSVTVEEFRKSRNPPPPDKGRESSLDRWFTEFSHMIGLNRQARERLNFLIREENVRDRVVFLHERMNKVADGGVRGFWTALQICLLPLPR